MAKRSGRLLQPKPQPVELRRQVEKPPRLKQELKKHLQHVKGDVYLLVGRPRRELHRFATEEGPRVSLR